MSICRAQWVDDLIGVIMRDDRHRLLSAIGSLEIVMSNRPHWFECFSLRRDLRDWFGNHFRHLFPNDRRFFLRNRHRFLSAVRSLEIVMSDRPYWFECFSFRRGLRDWFGSHFRPLFRSDRWFFVRGHLRRTFLCDYLRRF